MAIPTVVNTITSVTSSPASSLVFSALPTGATAGDLLVMFVALNENTVAHTIATPAGWRSENLLSQGTASRAQRWFRYMTSGETAPTVTWTGGTCNAVGAIVAVRGTNLAAIGDGSGNTTSGSGAPSSNSYTRSFNNDLTIYAATANGAGLVPQTPPTGFTEIVDTGSNTGTADVSIHISTIDRPTSGSEPSKNATGYTGSSCIFCFSLREATGATVISSANFEGGPGTELTELSSETMTGAGSTGDISSGAALVGTYGYQSVLPGGTTGKAYGSIGAGVPASMQYWLSHKIKVVSHSGTGNAWWTTYLPSTGNPTVRVGYISGTQTMRVVRKDATNLDVTLSSTLTVGNTYTLTLMADYRGTNPIFTLYLDGAQVATATDSTSGTLNLIATARLGGDETTNTKALTVNLDAFAATTADPGAATAPTAPQSLVATAINRGVQTSWAAPVSDGGSIITSYTVRVMNGVTQVATWTSPDGTARNHTFTGLTNGTTYTFKILATNAIGPSPEVTSSSFTPARVAMETWYQLGGNAQRTSSVTQTPSLPWIFCGSYGDNKIASDAEWASTDNSKPKPTHGPVDSYPIIGGSKLYSNRGDAGLFCFNLPAMDVAWILPWKNCVSTPVYRESADQVVVCQADGFVSRIPSSGSNANVRSYWTGAPLRKSPLLVGTDTVYVVTDRGTLHKISLANPGVTGTYLTGSQIYDGGASFGYAAETPASYSAVTNTVVYATADGYVHCVNATSGAVVWRVKPSGHTWNVIGGSDALRTMPTNFEQGWPVIAEENGVVFIRVRLNFDYIDNSPAGTSNPFPTTDAATTAGTVRTWLDANPLNKCLFALKLADGTEAFTPVAKYGSTEDYVNGTQRPGQGGMPSVIVNTDGTESMFYRTGNFASTGGGTTTATDWRWDGVLGEFVLNGTDLAGYVAGDARYVRMGSRFSSATGYFHINDEDSQVTRAGDAIFYTHWGATDSVTITDRTSARGDTLANPINTSILRTFIWNKLVVGSHTGINRASHYSNGSGTGARDRAWASPVNFGYYDAVTGAGYGPPGIAADDQPQAYSGGFTTRTVAICKEYIVFQGNAGDIWVFRHSGSGTTFASSVPSTAITLSGPSSASVGVASDVFVYKLSPIGSTPGATVTVTPTDQSEGGTFKNANGTTVTSFTLTAAEPQYAVTYTPATGDEGKVITITCTNNAGLINP